MQAFPWLMSPFLQLEVGACERTVRTLGGQQALPYLVPVSRPPVWLHPSFPAFRIAVCRLARSSHQLPLPHDSIGRFSHRDRMCGRCRCWVVVEISFYSSTHSISPRLGLSPWTERRHEARVPICGRFVMVFRLCRLCLPFSTGRLCKATCVPSSSRRSAFPSGAVLQTALLEWSGCCHSSYYERGRREVGW